MGAGGTDNGSSSLFPFPLYKYSQVVKLAIGERQTFPWYEAPQQTDSWSNAAAASDVSCEWSCREEKENAQSPRL